MKRLALVLALASITTPAWCAQKQLSVSQLMDLAKSLQPASKPDHDFATELKQVVLTEQLSAANLNTLAQYLPGAESTEQAYVLEARSAALAPPASEIPTTAALDPAAQTALLAKAQEYVAKTYSALPALVANKQVARFQDGVEAVHALTGINNNMSQESDPTFQQTKLYVRLVANVINPAQFAGGVEKLAVDKTKYGPNNIVASVGTPLALPTIVQEATASGSLKFARWETIAGKASAVFTFAVDKKKTKYNVLYCCFPDTDTLGVMSTGAGIGNAQSGAGAAANGNMQTVSEFKPFKTQVGYHGEIVIDPDTGIIVRTITQADFKKSDFVHNESIRTDYGPFQIDGKALVVPTQVFTASEVVPNGDSFASHYAVRQTFTMTDYKDYKAGQ